MSYTESLEEFFKYKNQFIMNPKLASKSSYAETDTEYKIQLNDTKINIQKRRYLIVKDEIDRLKSLRNISKIDVLSKQKMFITSFKSTTVTNNIQKDLCELETITNKIDYLMNINTDFLEITSSGQYVDGNVSAENDTNDDEDNDDLNSFEDDAGSSTTSSSDNEDDDDDESPSSAEEVETKTLTVSSSDNEDDDDDESPSSAEEIETKTLTVSSSDNEDDEPPSSAEEIETKTLTVSSSDDEPPSSGEKRTTPDSDIKTIHVTE